MFHLPSRALWMALSIALPTMSTAALPLPVNADLSAVPDPLRPWVPWVLREMGDEVCPGQDESSRICLASSKLSIQADKKGASFTLSGTRYSPGRVHLPGDSAAWPLDVRDRGMSVAIVGDEDDQPFVELPAGAFALTGRLTWKKRPASISLPADIAVRNLQVDGKLAAFDVEESRMWLESRLSEESEVSQGDEEEAIDTISSLEIRVQRLLQDGSPMELTTTLELTVGGKERRIQLPGVIPANARAVELKSSLAGRLDGKGGLELTLRPGTWNVEVTAVLTGTPSILEVNKAPDPWPTQEVWSFQENSNLRGLAFEGATSVNPIQAGLDPGLRNLPAWSLDSAHPLHLKVVRKGAVHPDSMKITLLRTLYIDALGQGATVQDRYLLDSWRPLRFSLRAPLEVSRILLNSATPSLITSNGPGEAGVNLYNPARSVEVHGRMQDGFWQKAPASAVDSRLEKLDLEVKAPMGWWILALTGVDGAEEHSTWRSIWTETELIYAALVVGLLYLSVGRLAALLAMGFLAAGRFDLIDTWPLLCLGIVLFLRALGDRLSETRQAISRRILTPLALLCLAWAAWSLFTDSRLQWMRIVHPEAKVEAPVSEPWTPRFASRAKSEERGPLVDTTAVVAFPKADQGPVPGYVAEGGSTESRTTVWAPASPSAVMSQSVMDKINTASDGLLGEDVDPSEANMIDVILAGGGGKLQKGHPGRRDAPGSGDRMHGAGRIGLGGAEKAAKRMAKPDIASKRERDPFLDGVIQTGPGIPTTWGITSRLVSAYPVPSDASVKIWSLGPLAVRAVRLLGILLGWILLVHIFRSRFPGAPATSKSTTPVAAAVALLCLMAPAPASAQAMPTSEMLEELRGTLQRAPECGQSCADISRIAVGTQGANLRLECTLQAVATTTVQLPQGDWTLVDISCPDCAFGSSGNEPFAVVSKGTHTLVMTGRPSGKEVVFSFPVRPRVLEVNTAGWTRLDDGRGSLHLSRAKGAAANLEPEEPAVNPNNLGASPFVKIERTFEFSREWTVTTRLVRASQFEGAVAIDYPLLPGEATLDGQAIDSGKARWVLPAGESWAMFHTRLRHDDSLVMVASSGPWSESWSARSHPRLEILHKGMPVTQRGEMTWTPFPGDTLKLYPKAWNAAKGPLVTIQSAEMVQNTDPRDPSGRLVFRPLASQGTDIQVRLPENAQLQSVERDGSVQNPNKLPDGRWNIPIHADTREVSVSWRIPGQNPFVGKAPRVELSASGVQFSTQLQVAPKRFVLMTGGQGAGVRCLWWAFLPVFFGLAWGIRKWSGGRVSLLQAALLVIPVSTIEGLGSSPLWLFAAALVWALAWRDGTEVLSWSTQRRRLLQTGIAACGAVVAIALVRLVASPLIGSPDFQPLAVSQPWTWVFDRSTGALPEAWVVILPIWAWKVALGLWLVWLGKFALPWLRKGWEIFTRDGLWPREPDSDDPSYDDSGVDTSYGDSRSDDSEADEEDRIR